MTCDVLQLDLSTVDCFPIRDATSFGSNSREIGFVIVWGRSVREWCCVFMQQQLAGWHLVVKVAGCDIKLLNYYVEF